LNRTVVRQPGSTRWRPRRSAQLHKGSGSQDAVLETVTPCPFAGRLSWPAAIPAQPGPVGELLPVADREGSHRGGAHRTRKGNPVTTPPLLGCLSVPVASQPPDPGQRDHPMTSTSISTTKESDARSTSPDGPRGRPPHFRRGHHHSVVLIRTRLPRRHLAGHR